VPDRSQPGSGGMEGGGAYNRHAALQAAGNTLAILHAREAARGVAIGPGHEPIVVADYGSSQGKNSLAPMRTIIEALRSRAGADRPVVVYHVDLPVNDFNALFKTLDADANSYTRDIANVYGCGVGRSFFQSVLPPGSVHFGWSAYAAQWLSCVPAVTVDHLWFGRLKAAARAIYEEQAAQDWETFLSLREKELRPGGRLVAVFPGIGSCEAIADHADAVIADMMKEGAVSARERSRMVPACWLRLEHDYRAPFRRNGRFLNLTVEHCESMPQADAAWEQYERDGQAESLATKHAAFFRATFLPSLTAALVRADDPQACRTFADRFEQGLRQRLSRQPTPTNSRVDTVVIAKLPADATHASFK
jgi:SAM dependent carboxyl methyltransferase